MANSFFRTLLLGLALSLTGAVMVGCDEDGPLEEAGEDIDEAAEDIGEE